ncbi:FmdB family zinc ribbon protein [Zooshikella harenae]|uniref:Zinc ribbon domain-containing protein n=1 Tax=Zooshikella harenae TaxID=2827238 RepID=A0ABS5Z8H0_9GAMM|nr:zinc ribbon domain-containing protein [Zooshikella harenae]MBU2710290.1 zinc ribbon domain-containing protein [Zooshikella harenae]
MPIYEYECGQCQHALEVIQKVSDEPLVTCPQCNTDALRKRLSAPAFRLKGGGWYETDFKTGKKKNLAESDSKASASKSNESNASNKNASSGSAKAPAKASTTSS